MSSDAHGSAVPIGSASRSIASRSRQLAPLPTLTAGPIFRMTAQRNAASEGLALGLVALGWKLLPDRQAAVDEAFATAWRGWPYRARFPVVCHDVEQGLRGEHIVTRARRTKHTSILYWTRAGALCISQRRSDWSPNITADLLAAADVIGGGVPLEGWIALANDFLHLYLEPTG